MKQKFIVFSLCTLKEVKWHLLLIHCSTGKGNTYSNLLLLNTAKPFSYLIKGVPENTKEKWKKYKQRKKEEADYACPDIC